MTSEEGVDVEFRHSRASRPVKVVPTKTAILALVGGLAAGGFSVGGVTLWAAKAFVTEQIHIHDRDPEAHAAYVRATERLRQAGETSETDKARLQAQLDALSKDVRETREAIIRLEARLGGKK